MPQGQRCHDLPRPGTPGLDASRCIAYRSADAWLRAVAISAGWHEASPPRQGSIMPFRINHIHLKSPDPKKAADWYVQAFNFKIVADDVRAFGDRFVRCTSEDGGINVNISGARSGETLGDGDAMPHHGLEHFGFDTMDIEADVARLQGLGAELLEGPIVMPNGGKIAFVKGPDNVRIELVLVRQ
jgi:catechol 2,3-dioxygenase-like lactoylglutathione lyase family enzyme